MLGSGATLHLALDRQVANRFDILLGLLPNPIEGRRFLVTGNVNVTMENQFGAGEFFHMNFESIRPQTQELELDFRYPYLFDLPFGTELAFDLYRRDTSFLDVNYEVGINYLLSSNTQLQIFVDNRSSRLLSIDRQQVIATRTLPTNLDLRRNLFGLGLTHRKLDYLHNPRRGINLSARASVGRKKIKVNEQILALEDAAAPEFDFGMLYQDLELNHWQFRATADMYFYIPLFNQSTLQLSQRAGIIGGSGQQFMNELFSDWWYQALARV